jgi:hypothetical protein
MLKYAPLFFCFAVIAGCGGGGASSSTAGSTTGTSTTSPSPSQATASSPTSPAPPPTPPTTPTPTQPTPPTPPPATASAQTYALTDIGAYTAPGATAIDNHDDVVVAQSSGSGSFYYDHSSGSVARLPSVDGSADTVMANGINDAGKISGWSGQNAVV